MRTTYIAAGIVIGILAVAIAGITFSANEQVEAQMGMMDHSSMGSGMMSTDATSYSHSGMFSGSGSSAVSNVQVTGIAVTGNNEATVHLRYTGTGAAPSIVVVAHTNKMGMMSMMHGGMTGMSGMGGMQAMGQSGSMMGGMSMMSGSSSYPAWTNTQWQEWHTQMAHQLAQTNSTQWQGWHSQMMMSPTWVNSTSTMPQYSSVQVGSTAVDAGWKNGTVKVELEGDGSAYDSSDVMAMVFPLTS